MLVYVVAPAAVAVAAAWLMLWPVYGAPLWSMYRDGDFAWAQTEGINGPRLAVIAGGAAAFLGVLGSVFVALFVTLNPLAVVSTLAVIFGGPVLGLAVLAYRSLTITVYVWFDDGTDLGGRISAREPVRDWQDVDARAFMPMPGGETIWLYAPPDTPMCKLTDPAAWAEFKAPDFLITAGQNASLFFARCDTSALRRNSNRRNKQGVKAETIRSGIILAFAGLFGLLGFLGMTAGAPVP